MINKTSLFQGCIGAGAALLVLFACESPPARNPRANEPRPSAAPLIKAASTPSSLKVALYPYVPRIQQFKDIITSNWYTDHPDVALQWADEWDGGYDMDPDPSYDVFVFDAINLGYFQAQNALLPLQHDQVFNYDDLVPFARAGVTVGDTVLAIPQLGCGDFLFYYSNDAAIAAATNTAELASAVGSCSYFTQTPPPSGGLMLDLAGGTTASSTYLESIFEQTGRLPSPLPPTIDPTFAAPIQQMVGLASFSQILYKNDANAYQRAAWFSQGMGRAYVGFTESMSQIDPQKLANVSFKPMPWSTNPKGAASPLFYSDVVGVSPFTQSRGTTPLAVKLANLMTSAAVIIDVFSPYEGAGPQYLMPVSTSALNVLSTRFPMYAQMSKVLGAVTPTLFNLGANSKPWLKQVKASMKSMVLANAQCYCDFPSPPIQDNADAQNKCPSACSSHVWNGQWSSASGSSVCGCQGACSAHPSNKVQPMLKGKSPAQPTPRAPVK